MYTFSKAVAAIQIILLVHLVPSREAATKVWKSEEQTPTWKVRNGNTKCAEHTLVFFESTTIEMSVPTEEFLVVRIVLPASGAIVLNGSRPIALQANVPPPCSWRFNGNYMYRETYFYSWFNEEMWRTEGEDDANLINSATPTVNRFPCECDDVVFPYGMTAAIYIDVNIDISVASVTVNGRRGNFGQFLRSKLGETMFYMEEADTALVTERNCDDRRYCGCHSYRRHMEHMDLVCSAADRTSECPAAHCLQPIKPIGFCCPQCGGAIITKTDNNTSSCGKNNLRHMLSMNQEIRKYMGTKWSDLVDIYLNYFPNESDDNNLLQITIMDKGEYSGKSIEFVKEYQAGAKCKQ